MVHTQRLTHIGFSMERVIYLDMDQVLADFEHGAYRVHNTTHEEVVKQGRKPGDWSLEPWLGGSQNKFWEPIHKAGKKFWLGLPPLPWIRQLISLVRYYSMEWYVLTSPSICHTSYVGKLMWGSLYDIPTDKIIITKHKHLLAKPGALLIDDRKKSVDRVFSRRRRHTVSSIW